MRGILACVLVSFLLLSLVTASSVSKRYHVKWITPQTVYPFLFEVPVRPLSAAESTLHTAFYDWYKHDEHSYVSNNPRFYRPIHLGAVEWSRQSPLVKECFHVKTSPYKTALVFTDYDYQSHGLLTTYEPALRHLRFGGASLPTADTSTSDLFTIVEMRSHRIEVDRSEPDAVSLKCVAEFYVDEVSMDLTQQKLVEQMKHLSVMEFSTEPSKYNVFTKKSEENEDDIDSDEEDYKSTDKSDDDEDEDDTDDSDDDDDENKTPSKNSTTVLNTHKYTLLKTKNSYSQSLSSVRIQRRSVDESSLHERKELLSVTLSLGPVRLEKPFKHRLVSCGLRLVDADGVRLEYNEKKYMFITDKDSKSDSENTNNEYHKRISHSESVEDTLQQENDDEEDVYGAELAKNLIQTANNLVNNTTQTLLDMYKSMLEPKAEEHMEPKEEHTATAKTMLFLLDKPENENELSRKAAILDAELIPASAHNFYPSCFLMITLGSLFLLFFY